MLILLFNGQSRIGKDTVAKLLAQRLPEPVHIRSFAQALKERTHGLFGLGNIAFDHFENVKDQPRPEFHGMTPREAYIWVSEKVLKPKFGDDILGHLLRDDVQKLPATSVVLVTSCGFTEEAMPMVRHFGPAHFMLYRITAAFGQQDSRQTVHIPEVWSADVINVEGRPEALADRMHADIIDYVDHHPGVLSAPLVREALAP